MKAIRRVKSGVRLAGVIAAIWVLTVPGSALARPGYLEARDQSIATAALGALSCLPGTLTCVAADSVGELHYTTQANATGSAAWSLWGGPGVGPAEALACPATTLCVLAAGTIPGGGGNLYRAHTLGGSFSTSFTPMNGVDTISCPTESFCAAGENGEGFIRVSNDPSGISWRAESIGEGAMTGISCLSASFCAAVDDSGQVHVAIGEIAVRDASAWVATEIEEATALRGISCISTTRCIAVDGGGEVLDLTIAPDGSAGVSRRPVPGATELDAISCLGATCAAGGSEGQVFGSADGGSTWTPRWSDEGAVGAVSCLSASLCAAVTSEGAVITFNPATTTPPLVITTHALPAGSATLPYEASLAAEGGDAPYAWSALDLPPGLSIDEATGRITGTPATTTCSGPPCPQPPATYTPTITATDADATKASEAFTIHIRGTAVRLQVHLSGDGSGQVSADDSAIRGCGAAFGNCAADYEDTSVVTLHAAPSAGSTFVGWSGAGCAGTGECRVALAADADVGAVFAKAPPAPGQGPSAVPGVRPQTKITKAVIHGHGAVFHFVSSVAEGRFQCVLVREGRRAPRFRSCTSPVHYSRLTPGRYVFRVRVTGPGGTDPTPARRTFRVAG